jgi:hypothetical protein
MDGSTALTIYREEKARALQERRISHAQLMTEAKEAFAKMLADAQLARKGGRPKNNPNAPPKVVAAPVAAPEKKPVAVAAKAVPVVAKPAAAKAVPAKVVVAKQAKVKAAPVKKVVAAKKPAKPAAVKAKSAVAAHKPAKKKAVGAHHAPARASKPAVKAKPKKK